MQQELRQAEVSKHSEVSVISFDSLADEQRFGTMVAEMKAWPIYISSLLDSLFERREVAGCSIVIHRRSKAWFQDSNNSPHCFIIPLLTYIPTAKEHVCTQQYPQGSRQRYQEGEENPIRLHTRNGP